MPKFIVNTKVLEKNIDFMLEKAKKSNTIFRPHFKTHQSAAIGKLFLKKGIEKITVSSLKMAEYFASNGFDDITIAIPVNLNHIEDINKLADKITLNITLSSNEISTDLIKKLNNKIGVFIEINLGYNRSGINSNELTSIEEIITKTISSNL